MISGSNDDDRPITRDDLERVFVEAEKPSAEWLIGGEAEKFGVYAGSLSPLTYAGERGVTRIFESLVAHQGWRGEAETEDGPVIALSRANVSITLEPGAQLELSGAPHEDVHAVDAEMRAHLVELGDISRELDVSWLGVGFHPFATPSELPWVPKHRYGVMKQYLPARGARGLDMMQRTATVQANFDYANEEDAMRKLVVSLRLSAIVHAMTANSPFLEGRVSTNKSERGSVWLHMDPSRSGIIPALWRKERPRYADYVEWALDAGMFLFRRPEGFVHNTGQTFRSFLAEGYHGHRATYGDWVLHLNTLFPEARLKRTIEARSCDCLPASLMASVPAVFTGILYDEASLARAESFTRSFDPETVIRDRPGMVARGLAATLGGVSVQRLAEEVLDLANAGLSRRAKVDAGGRDERACLAGLTELVGRGVCPADVCLEGLSPGQSVAPADLLRRSSI